MVEIYDLAGTRSFGNYAHIKSTWGQLNYLRETGHLGKWPIVRVSSYQGNTLHKVYRAEYCGKWRLILEWSAPGKKSAKKTSMEGCMQNKTRPKKGHKIISNVYATVENTSLNGRQHYGIFSREY